MFTHIRIGTNDVQRAQKFYDGALGALGLPASADFKGNLFYPGPNGSFIVGKPIEGEATGANGGTIGFSAQDNEAVDKFHAAGLANGGTCEGKPGPRSIAGRDIYGAYLRDPDGNKICALVMQQG